MKSIVRWHYDSNERQNIWCISMEQRFELINAILDADSVVKYPGFVPAQPLKDLDIDPNVGILDGLLECITPFEHGGSYVDPTFKQIDMLNKCLVKLPLPKIMYTKDYELGSKAIKLRMDEKRAAEAAAEAASKCAISTLIKEGIFKIE